MSSTYEFDGKTREKPRKTETSLNATDRQRDTSRVADLGGLIRTKRRAEGLTLQMAARESGVSPATLWRLEKMADPDVDRTQSPSRTPDMKTILAVTDWLGVSLERFTESVPDRAVFDDGKRAESVPAVVEMHLRADRNLSSEAASKLATMFRLAYEAFAVQADEAAPPTRETPNTTGRVSRATTKENGSDDQGC